MTKVMTSPNNVQPPVCLFSNCFPLFISEATYVPPPREDEENQPADACRHISFAISTHRQDLRATVSGRGRRKACGGWLAPSSALPLIHTPNKDVERSASKKLTLATHEESTFPLGRIYSSNQMYLPWGKSIKGGFNVLPKETTPRAKNRVLYFQTEAVWRGPEGGVASRGARRLSESTLGTARNNRVKKQSRKILNVPGNRL